MFSSLTTIVEYTGNCSTATDETCCPVGVYQLTGKKSLDNTQLIQSTLSLP